MEIYQHLNYGGGTQNPTKIIVHAMGEFIHSNDGDFYAVQWLNKLHLSAHCLITPSGSIIRCREDSLMAWHARGFNDNTLGVEFLVPGLHDYETFKEAIQTDWVSLPQLSAGIELIKRWRLVWPIEGILRHSDVSPERKVDPGSGFPFDKLTA